MKYVNEAAFTKMVTLQKGYIDNQDATKQDRFSIGKGLELKEGTLNVTLDTTIFKVVDSLPDSPAAGDENKIHLVLTNTGKTGNEYTEYLWVNGKWEELGKFIADVDLTPYLKVAELTATVNNNSIEFLKQQAVLAKIAFGTSLAGVVANGNTLTINLAEVLSSEKAEGFYKVQVDKYGRVVSVEDVTEQDIKDLGFSTTTEMETAIEVEKNRATGAENQLTQDVTELKGKVQSLEAAEEAREDFTSSDAETLFNSIYGEVD